MTHSLCVFQINPYAQSALGCRFTTAYRAVLQQGRLQADESVAVFGCGGVGLSCIMIAASHQADVIVAVDVSDSSLTKARELGATHTILVENKDNNEARDKTTDVRT